MAEKNLDFDQIIDRKNTDSVKYDFAVQKGMPEDVLPFWVADMDFRVSSYIQEAVVRQAEHGIYGYSESKEDYFEAVQKWMKIHHNWDVEESWLVKTPGIVFAAAMAIKAFTEKGDSILIQQPVYYPFGALIRGNGRKIADNTLLLDKNGKYRIDIDGFEKLIKDNNVRLFILCNPHNPTGRVFTAEELTQMGDICLKYGVTVFSDEIHFDFVHKGKHNVFASVKDEYKDISIVCTSPSKTFNIAGLQVSNIFIPNSRLRQRFCSEIEAAGCGHINAAGLAACKAAYTDGEEWYEAMLAYVQSNIAYIGDFIKNNIPKLKVMETEGTYLVWIDFRGLGIDDKKIDDLVINNARLWFDSGAIFGKPGEGFQRINAACPRALLRTALERLEKAVNTLNM